MLKSILLLITLLFILWFSPVNLKTNEVTLEAIQNEVMSISMMPNGLFETLSNKEIIDLVGFLSRSK